jgi:carbon monoxide dehydrogenase subunit G
MASIHKDISIDAHPDDVWAAVRDFGAVHQRLAPGFVTDCRLDGDDRIVTFISGNVVRELLLDIDDQRRRLAYAIVNERFKHHSASIQVFADGDQRTRLVWIADLLPDELASFIDAQTDLGVVAMQSTLGRKAA